MDEIDKKVINSQISKLEDKLDMKVSRLEEFKSDVVSWSEKLKKWSTTFSNTISKRFSKNEQKLDEFEKRIKRLENESINTGRENRKLNQRVKQLERENRELQDRASTQERFLNNLTRK